MDKCNKADKFNMFYIQSVSKIVQSIDTDMAEQNSYSDAYDIEGREILEKFVLIKVEELERIVMELPKKKGTDEGITTDIPSLKN